MVRNDPPGAMPALRASRGAGAAVLVAGWLIALPASVLYLDLARDRLHLLCAFVRQGTDDPGDWVCAQGLSYTGVDVYVLLGATVMAILGAAVLVLVRGPRAATRVLLALTPFPLGWALAGTAYAAGPLGPHGRYWWSAVGVAGGGWLALTAAAVVIACMRGRAQSAAALVGGAILLVATVAQPGLLWADILSAALLIAAVAVSSAPDATDRDQARRAVSQSRASA